jgi:tetratricopeptide (TPR) repeat protein
MFNKGKVKASGVSNHEETIIRRPLSNIDFSALLDTSKREESLYNEKDAGTDFSEKPKSLSELIYESYEMLKHGDFDKASVLLKKAVFIDLSSSMPSAMLKCADYWAEKKRHYMFKEKELQSDFLMESWQSFIKMIVSRLDTDIDRTLFCIKSWVFLKIAEGYENVLKLNESGELYIKLGRAYKIKGDYDKAIAAYSNAVMLQKDNPAALAELADCYAIIDEENNARVLFREAFYQGAQKIDLTLLESAMILNLKERVRALGIDDSVLKLWMAVYGVIWGLFYIARELRPIEYQKLNQSIHLLRTEYGEKGERNPELKPLLLYRLFWFIDYHRALLSDKTMAEEYIKRSLLEIRFIDERIYRDYKI